MTFTRYLRLLLGFLTTYLILILYLRSICWNDPGSVFFRPEQARTPRYSAHRIQQAIERAEFASTLAGVQGQQVERNPLDLCIGIPSVRRKGISYLKSTLGSLQQGLSYEERIRLHFVVLLAHLNQTEHPDYGAPWLSTMADTVASYHDDEERLKLARKLDSETHELKSKFDYSVVMEECEKVGAPYTLMVEDDVIFLDGWRHRTMRALDIARAKSWEAGRTDFLYLRLFYYEGLLNWNSESWPKYLGSSIAVTATVLSSLLLCRRFTRLRLPNSVILLVAFVFTPLYIALFFAAGGHCMIPQPVGVHMMNKYACCGQGLVFPRSTVTNDLLPLFRNNIWSKKPTDTFIEKYADETGALRWALTPVVMQHVGGQSSHKGRRGKTYGPSRLWNFGFEENDPNQLAREHAQARISLVDDLQVEVGL